MKGELYRRWLTDERGLTLSEFVAERRAELRQQRAQRRWAAHMAPMMQQAPPSFVLMQQLGMQNAPLGMYRGFPMGGLGSFLGGLFR